MEWEKYQRECYLLGRNEKDYLADGSFNNRIMYLVENAPKDSGDEAVAFLEKMVSHAPEYYEMEDKYLPILVYKSEPICYGVLNHFADLLIEALENLGQCVEVFDTQEHPLDDLRAWSQKRYKAVVGMQSYLFSIQLNNGENLHDYFDCPKYNMILDHPVVMHKHLLNAPKGMTVLTHDRNYQKYIEDYYAECVKAEILPPGGEEALCEGEKKYNLTFVGSYRNWRDWSDGIRQLNRKYPGLVRRAIGEMKRHPNATYEECMRKYTCNMSLSVEQERDLLYECRESYYCVMDFYRQRIIATLLDAGIELEVYGDSWNTPALAGYANLIRHEAVDGQQSLLVYGQSKLSLNIMSWHKDGMTERIANMLLNGTVVVSDKSTYLEDNFAKGEELILFELSDIPALPDTIKGLLQDDVKRQQIEVAGRERAREQHTWKNRAKSLLELISQE